jgi:hypothetical protein
MGNLNGKCIRINIITGPIPTTLPTVAAILEVFFRAARVAFWKSIPQPHSQSIYGTILTWDIDTIRLLHTPNIAMGYLEQSTQSGRRG